MKPSPYGILSFSFFLLVGVCFLVLAYQGVFDKEYTITKEVTITQQYDDRLLIAALGQHAAAIDNIGAQVDAIRAKPAPTRDGNAYCTTEQEGDVITLNCKRFP